MSNSSQYYDAALLSEAAYVFFDKIVNLTDAEEVEKALQNKKYQGKMTAQQAADFVATWEIVSHQENTESGFSATLFKNIHTQQYYYACRGTETTGLLSALDDLAITDVFNIVTDGVAFEQVVDMYNDWQRIITPYGQAYEAVTLDLLVLETAQLAFSRANLIPGVAVNIYEQSLLERDDILIDKPSGMVYTIERVSSDLLYSDKRQFGLGKIIYDNSVTAVGHSLGGHLAVSFSRLFEDTCQDVISVNGAGFMTGNIEGLGSYSDTNIRNLFQMLEGSTSFAEDKILGEGVKSLLDSTCFEGLRIKVKGNIMTPF